MISFLNLKPFSPHSAEFPWFLQGSVFRVYALQSHAFQPVSGVPVRVNPATRRNALSLSVFHDSYLVNCS